jgi:uncharacterized membrane protein
VDLADLIMIVLGIGLGYYASRHWLVMGKAA